MPLPSAVGTPPETFHDRYALLERLGRGEFGEVWKAEDTNTGRVVALKMLRTAGGTPDEAWQEATHLTSLESPCLVRVYGAALAVDVPYIDTEYLPGGDTADACAPVGVPPSTAVRWTRQVAQGLNLCHDRRILHRDVKPGNVLLDANGDARLGDFGVSAIMDTASTAAPHGDRQILAPEVIWGDRCSRNSDVYSLGITLYAYLTGRLPHRFEDHRLDDGSRDLRSFLLAAVAGPAPVRDVAPHVGTALGRIVAKATAVDPAARYESAADLDQALAALPSAKRDICEVPPHPHAERCWDAAATKGPATAVHVCLAARADGSTYDIVTRHSPSDRRITRYCTSTPRGRLGPALRRTFDALR